MSLVAAAAPGLLPGPGLTEAVPGEEGAYGVRAESQERHQGYFRNRPADAQIGFLGSGTRRGELSMEGWNLA
jgi:hypothetical protein